MRTRLAITLVATLLWTACGGPSDDGANDTDRAPALPDDIVMRLDDSADRDQSVDTSQASADSESADTSEPSERDDVAPTVPNGRRWKDAAGNVLGVGQLVSRMGADVCLETPDGGGVVVPFDQLCQADRDYVLAQAGDDLAPAEPTSEAAEDSTDETLAAASSDQGELPRRALEEGSSLYGDDKVVIPFDFVSNFDDGRYGGMVGDMIWAKLDREEEVVIPESMLDVRDACTANNVSITPDTPIDRVRQVVTEQFGADVGIWGSVERAPGHEWEVYDLVIKCVDFSSGPEPKVIYEKRVRTNSVSEIPHLYAREMLDALYGRKPGEPPPPDPIAEKNWLEGPNLVVGGDFQQGSNGVPYGWESTGGQDREPLGNLVRWMPEAGENAANKLIRFTFGESVGNGFGVMYYSKPFVIEEGATYRFGLRYRSNGPKIIIFIKCYDEMPSQYSAAGGRSSPRSGRDYIPDVPELRECYRSQQNLKGPHNTWNTHTEDFTPRHTKAAPRWGRVDLYSYLGAGVVEFDDVVLKQILPPSPGESRKVRRHSMESDVTLEQMRANEARARSEEDEDEP